MSYDHSFMNLLNHKMNTSSDPLWRREEHAPGVACSPLGSSYRGQHASEQCLGSRQPIWVKCMHLSVAPLAFGAHEHDHQSEITQNETHHWRPSASYAWVLTFCAFPYIWWCHLLSNVNLEHLKGGLDQWPVARSLFKMFQTDNALRNRRVIFTSRRGT